MDDGTGEQVALELRDRLFERGEDISDPSVLAAVAETHGVSSSELDPAGGGPASDVIEQEWELGRARGVVGSPHFFAGGIDMFCPSLRIENSGGRLRVEPDQEGFERLVAACFA
jgi:2-hydroxychromene-2-carboxylate isomerase